MTLGRRTRWLIRHGAPRWVLAVASRLGHLPATVLHTRLAGDSLYDLHRTIRQRGELVGDSLAMATCRHATADALLRDPGFEAGARSSPVARFALERGLDPRARGPLDEPSLLVTDGPAHIRLRTLVSSAFTPRALADLDAEIARIAAALLDDLAAEATSGEPVDLVRGYAQRLPVAVIGHLLGIPGDMLGRFLEWSDRASPSLDLGLGRSQFRIADEALVETNLWLAAHFDRLRRGNADDVLSRLVKLADEEGDRLDDVELMAVTQLLLAAGFVTIVDLLGNGVVLLLRHPEQLSALLEQPDGWPNAIEEILRYESPVQITARFCSRPRLFGGRHLPRGQAVLALLGGANRDPEFFEDPDRFDVTRADARGHLAFSRGAHHCLGAGLARLEGRIGLQQLFERFPRLGLAAPPTRRPGAVLRGYSEIMVTLDSGTGRRP